MDQNPKPDAIDSHTARFLTTDAFFSRFGIPNPMDEGTTKEQYVPAVERLDRTLREFWVYYDKLSAVQQWLRGLGVNSVVLSGTVEDLKADLAEVSRQLAKLEHNK